MQTYDSVSLDAFLMVIEMLFRACQSRGMGGNFSALECLRAYFNRAEAGDVIFLAEDGEDGLQETEEITVLLLEDIKDTYFRESRDGVPCVGYFWNEEKADCHFEPIFPVSAGRETVKSGKAVKSAAHYLPIIRDKDWFLLANHRMIDARKQMQPS